MAIDKTGTWSLGESTLWYSPNSGLDATWVLGESYILDEAPAPVIIKLGRFIRKIKINIAAVGRSN